MLFEHGQITRQFKTRSELKSFSSQRNRWCAKKIVLIITTLKNAISPEDTKNFINKLFMSFLYDEQFSAMTELKTV